MFDRTDIPGKRRKRRAQEVMEDVHRGCKDHFTAGFGLSRAHMLTDSIDRSCQILPDADDVSPWREITGNT